MMPASVQAGVQITGGDALQRAAFDRLLGTQGAPANDREPQPLTGMPGRDPSSGAVVDSVLRRLELLRRTADFAPPAVASPAGGLVAYLRSFKDGALGGLRHVAPTVEDILGFSIREAMQPGWWEACVHPADRPSPADAGACLARDGSWSAVYRIRHKAGRYIRVFDKLRLIRDPLGWPVLAVGAWVRLPAVTRAP